MSSLGEWGGGGTGLCGPVHIVQSNTWYKYQEKRGLPAHFGLAIAFTEGGKGTVREMISIKELLMCL